MGNGLGHSLYDTIDYLYEKFYPKSKYLRPEFVSTAFMLTKVVCDLTLKAKPIALYSFYERHIFIFLASIGATASLQLWISFFDSKFSIFCFVFILFSGP
jgi:hypothetical protein